MMGGGGGGGNATAIQSVQVNSSNYGSPIPIVYGQNRISTNCIWYNNFQAIAEQQGGKGGGGGASSYTYTAAVMLALCEGPINGIGNIYKDRAVLTLTDGDTPLEQDTLTSSLGTTSQAPWSYVVANYPTQALAYSRTAWVGNENMALDSTAGIPNYNLEVLGLFQTENGYNNRGTWNSSAAYAMEDYVIDPTNSLPYLALQAVPPGQPQPINDQVNGVSVNWTLIWSTTPDANPKDLIPDILSNPYYGAGFPASSIADLTDYGNYCKAAGFFFSPALDQQQEVQQYISDWTSWSNSAPVWSQGKLKVIPYGDETIIGNGVTWTPSNGIVYFLTDDDFIYSDGSDPVQVDRSSPSDAYNDFKLQWSDRANNYNTAVAEAMDQATIDLYGLRAQGTITANGICQGSTAQLSVQLMLQRALYIRNTYTFTLPLNFCLLEPMDVVAITDDILGFDELLVRVTDVEEDDNFNLKITAEDFIVGIGTAVGEHVQGGGKMPISPGADPGNISDPVMLNVPSNLSNGQLQLWIAGSGGENWGGAEVWVSLDNTTYEHSGTINGPSRYGVTTADFPANGDPDTTDTLSVDLSASLGTLDSATNAQADAAATLSWVNGELISYSTATLTSGNSYDLTSYIRRGQQATMIVDHPSGSQFVRLDNTIFKYPYISNQIGITLYVKFLSFNVYGNKQQRLADVSPFTVVLGIAPPDLSGFAINVDSSGSTALFSWPPNTATQVLNGGAVEIRFENVTSGASWSSAVFVGNAPGNATSVDLPYIAGGTYLAKAVDANGVYCNDPQIIQSGSSSGGGTLTATISPTSLSGTASGHMSPTAGPVTVIASGGTPPYTYAWNLVSGSSNIVPTDSASATPSFKDPTLTSIGIANSVYACTITDSASGTFTTPNVSIHFEQTGFS